MRSACGDNPPPLESMARSCGVKTATTTGRQPNRAPTFVSTENGTRNFREAASHTP
jgi:hypothetical protein